MIASPVIQRQGVQRPGARPSSFPLARKRLRFYKRAVDLAISTVLILGVVSWLLPLLAVLIRADSTGPVFFVQQRRKRGRATFGCIKLRTMIINEAADTMLATAGDRRITRIGRWLRLTHLDELPQLFNVWLGDMSLVGPRPYMLQEDTLYLESMSGYERRTLVKPGITGLAQSKGNFGSACSGEELDARLLLDLDYIQHWSPGLDIRILARTIRFLWPA